MAATKENKEIKQPIKLRFRTLADGRQSIFLDYSKNGKHSYEFLKLYLLPETTKANERKNKAVMKEANAVLKERVAALVEKKGKEQTCVSSKMLLSEWLDRYHALLESRGSRCLKRVSTLKRMMERFDISARLCNVDKDFFLRFTDYIRNDYVTVLGTRLKPKSARNYIDDLSTAISCAVEEGLMAGNPYFKIATSERIRVPESMREYLTVDEVKALMEAPIANPRKNGVIKNAFLFSCFCGLRISDIVALRWRDISEERGQKYASVIMRKTEAPIYIPLSRQAVKWMPERGEADADAPVFEGLKNDDKLARCLQKWTKAAGITKHITFHCARHTCATMLLTLGADIYTVSKILGHRRLKETQIYAKIVNGKKDAAVNLADKAFA